MSGAVNLPDIAEDPCVDHVEPGGEVSCDTHFVPFGPPMNNNMLMHCLKGFLKIFRPVVCVVIPCIGDPDVLQERGRGDLDEDAARSHPVPAQVEGASDGIAGIAVEDLVRAESFKTSLQEASGNK